MTRFATLAILAASVLAPACTDDLPPPNTPPPGSTSGGTSDTFDHENDQISPWDLLQRIEVEGPPSYTSHTHSCPKVRYSNLGSLLTDIGVNAANTTQLSAGELYTDGYNALGGPNYANRIRENIGITISGASKEFDIFAAAAPEVMAAFTSTTTNALQARCPGAQLFDTSGSVPTCRPDGIECLIGVPPQSEHVDYCNLTITNASTPAVGQQLAVAAILAAAYTCE
ncbi:MAG TPA: hypothetical protein VMJ10_09935 [Kofleriaceae bacterium]|nr:hypothetical protein [Kofleriaceae bacterium]